MSIMLVAAISQNNCIGKHGELPWKIPEDMKRMREITRGKVLIMGRKTWESIPENRRPLPDRTNVVITRDEKYLLPPDVERYSSIEDALKAHEGEEIVGFGGQKIFEAMLPIADVLEITHVHQEVEHCDAFFPKIHPEEWNETWREDHGEFSFVTYVRNTKITKLRKF